MLDLAGILLRVSSRGDHSIAGGPVAFNRAIVDLSTFLVGDAEERL
jgi:hypothetical protein